MLGETEKKLKLWDWLGVKLDDSKIERISSWTAFESSLIFGDDDNLILDQNSAQSKFKWNLDGGDSIALI